MKFTTKVALVLSGLACAAVGYVPDAYVVLPVPKTIRTLGERTSARGVSLTESSLQIVDSAGVCDADCKSIIKNAFDRSILQAMKAQKGLAPWKLSPHPEFTTAPVADASLAETITKVSVAFTGLCAATTPMVAANTTLEHYELAVDRTGAVKIDAHTVWGAMHALESLCQTIEWNGRAFVVQHVPLAIEDEPRFPWRGFMVDVARHYMPLKKLRNLVDALAAFKMNVMHMHLSDAQSFPLEIPELPAFANSTFSPKAVYTTQDMKELQEYARVRGVLIVPEVDIPAHTASWRFAGAEVTADCFASLAARTGSYEENLVALNPAAQQTWDTIDTVLARVAATFDRSPYMHVGGDEVSEVCWKECRQRDEILAYMKQHSLATYQDVEVAFERYTQKGAGLVGRTPIVWDDVLTKNGAMIDGTIVHAWHSSDRLVQAVRTGHRVVQSYGYYLDRQSPLCSGTCSGINWMFSWTYRDMYKTDPTANLGLSADEEARVLGGETALFAESIDAPNFDAMGISRLGAFAERFWSPVTVTDPKNLEVRTQRLRCLNVRRGIAPSAGPLSSDFCETVNFF